MKVYAQKNGLTIFGFNKKTYLFNYVYLHGDLELENGYDIVDTETKEEQNIPEGIYNIEVVLHDGRIVPGRLYYWKGFDEIYHGLIVKPTDEEGINYALEYYDNRMSTWEENDMVKPTDFGISIDSLQNLVKSSIPKDTINRIDDAIYNAAKDGNVQFTFAAHPDFINKDIYEHIEAISIYYKRRGIQVHIIEGSAVCTNYPDCIEPSEILDIIFDWSFIDLSNPLYK